MLEPLIAQLVEHLTVVGMPSNGHVFDNRKI